MHIKFTKYQGTGNDFVMIDNRAGTFDRNDVERVRQICSSKFGVGADGLILIELHPEYDFEMVYFNSDGSQSLCGNGSRCAVNFAKELGMIAGTTHFLAIDGPHRAVAHANGWVSLQMADQHAWELKDNQAFLNNGSPHLVLFVSDVAAVNVAAEGVKFRYSDRFKPQGTNVNFVERISDQNIFVRTYERGVENETLSCGTGVTASALLASLHYGISSPVNIKTKGGDLSVKFRYHTSYFSDIWLEGPALKVFEGTMEV